MANLIAKDSEDKITNEMRQQIALERKNERLDIYAWDLHKENIQPLRQGRKMDTLMKTLPMLDCNKERKEHFEERRIRFEEELKTHEEDASKQLDMWCEYIDWLEQNVPDGGKVNGITNAIEQCIEIYYDKKDFKQDKRLFDVFMKFKGFCDEPIEVFGFMYTNSICTLLANLYLNWSWQYEIRKNMKRAEDLIKLGLKNLASPREVLVEASEQLKCRLDRMIRAGELDVAPETGTMLSAREMQEELNNGGIRAALQTLKFKVNKKKGCQVAVNRIGEAIDQTNVGGLKNQTKLVNGVRVAKKVIRPKGLAGSSGVSTGVQNARVVVYSDENVSSENQSTTTDSENAINGFHLPKIPTRQLIQVVGRSGTENQQPRFGTLSS